LGFLSHHGKTVEGADVVSGGAGHNDAGVCGSDAAWDSALAGADLFCRDGGTFLDGESGAEAERAGAQGAGRGAGVEGGDGRLNFCGRAMGLANGTSGRRAGGPEREGPGACHGWLRHPDRVPVCAGGAIAERWRRGCSCYCFR